MKKPTATGVVTEQTLRLLKSVNSFVSIFGVAAAADAALAILALAQTVGSKTAGFIEVGEMACTIMVTVIEKVNVAEQSGNLANMSTIKKSSDELRREMEGVEIMIRNRLKGRKRFVLLEQILFSRTDKDVIKKCKDRLQLAIDSFGVQTHIEVRQGVEDANKKLDQLVEHGEGLRVNQYAYSHIEDKGVRVSGSGNNINVSRGSVSTTIYHPGQFY